MEPVKAVSPTERGVVARQVEYGLNAVPTSSMGRLFDAVAALSARVDGHLKKMGAVWK